MFYLQPELHEVIVDVLQLVSVTVAKLNHDSTMSF